MRIPEKEPNRCSGLQVVMFGESALVVITGGRCIKTGHLLSAPEQNECPMIS